MRILLALFLVILAGIAVSTSAQRQDPTVNGRGGGRTLYGDVLVAGEQLNNGKPVKIDITLYSEFKNVVEHSVVFGNGRYRFNNLSAAIYEVVAEVDGQEVLRERVDLRSPLVDDYRHDLSFEWRATGPSRSGAGTVPADSYQRNAANSALM